MTYEEINQARQKYESINEERIRINKIRKRLDALRKIPEVQEYIKIISLEQEKLYLDYNALMEVTISQIAKNTKNSNNLLVFMGTYQIDPKANIKNLKDEYEDFYYALYRDIETEEDFKVPLSVRSYLEQDYKTIYLNISKKIERLDEDIKYDYYNKLYIQLRKKILKMMMTCSQYVAIKETLKIKELVREVK